MAKQTLKDIHHGRTSLTTVRKFYPNVLQVIDAVKPLMIEVTPQDAAKSTRGKHSKCAMAVAVERLFEGAIISRARSFIIQGDTAFRYQTPASVAREITSFDRGATFDPGVYQLSPPEKALGAKHGKRGDKNGHRPDSIPETKPFKHITKKIREIVSQVA